MKRVTGIGGIFFKSEDPARLYAWYEKHLGIKAATDGSGAIFPWSTPQEETDANSSDDLKANSGGMTVWSIFPRSTKYFDPSSSPFMINYCVENLDALLEELKKEGVTIDPRREDYDYGRFAWIMDPDGNRIELWEPRSSKTLSPQD
jgi:predicted enzyme related to lactoylglutathione lyase